MFQITSGFSRSRLVRSSAALESAKSNARSTWKHSCASRKSGWASSTISAGLREALRRLRVTGHDLRIDRRDAEIGRIGDPLRLASRRGPRQRKNFGEHRQRQRIAGMLAAHRVEQQREVLDIARHRALHAEVAIHSPPGRSYARRGRCSAAGRRCRRSSPDCAASRPCRSHAPARPCRSRAPTAAPPEEPAAERDGVPGIAGRAEHFVEGVGAGAEFRRVRLGVDHAAIAFEMLDQDVGFRRDGVLVDRRALRGAHAGDSGEVLDRDRQPGEQAALGQPASSSARSPAGGRDRSTASAAR